MAEVLHIRGGIPLQGTVKIPAAKNSVLPILAASILSCEEVVLQQVPRLADVWTSIELLQGLGFEPCFEEDCLTVRAGASLTGQVPTQPAQAMRSSVFYLAPLLHRVGWAAMPLPGGCDLGPRPIDIHLDGLAHMGAKVEWSPQGMMICAPKRLRGIDYTLRLPSVGATETLLMAAAQAQGNTVLRNAACEPEIVDLASFLCACGAKIKGAGSPVIQIEGVDTLHGAVYTPMPDRITAATFACAVATAGGCVTLKNSCPKQLAPVLRALKHQGCEIIAQPQGLLVARTGGLQAVGEIHTGGYPQFPTDAAPIAAAAALTAHGFSSFYDSVFEHRFACAEGFSAMGADVICRGRKLCIQGVPELCGARVSAPDLRGGAALVVAALGAQGESTITGLHHIRRGYADLTGMLRQLGADVMLLQEQYICHSSV